MSASKLDLEKEARDTTLTLHPEVGCSSPGQHDPLSCPSVCAPYWIVLAALRRVQEATRAEDCELAFQAVCKTLSVAHVRHTDSQLQHAIRRALLGKGE